MDNQQELEENLKEIQKKLNGKEELTPEEIKKILEDSKDNVNFIDLIDTIDISGNSWVIFTNKEEQLVNDNGEFYIQNTTDGTKSKRKIDKEIAKKMYLDYVITYLINPLLEKKNLRKVNKNLSRQEHEKTKVSQRVKENDEKKVNTQVIEQDKKQKEKNRFQ